MNKIEFASKAFREPTGMRELTDSELAIVSGGRKAGEGQKDFLVVTLKEVYVANWSVSTS
jgi:hypothetical protein